MGILWANAMLGEITPKMAEAVASNPARKILLPLSQEPVEIVGAIQGTLAPSGTKSRPYGKGGTQKCVRRCIFP